MSTGRTHNQTTRRARLLRFTNRYHGGDGGASGWNLKSRHTGVLVRVENIFNGADGGYVLRILAAEEALVEYQPRRTGGRAGGSLAKRAARGNADWLVLVAGIVVANRAVP